MFGKRLPHLHAPNHLIFLFKFLLSYLRGGLISIPASEITVMTLKNPNQPSECDDRTKQDFECLMADQCSGDIYLVQKNIYYPDVSIYKVCLSVGLLLNVPTPIVFHTSQIKLLQ